MAKEIREIIAALPAPYNKAGTFLKSALDLLEEQQLLPAELPRESPPPREALDLGAPLPAATSDQEEERRPRLALTGRIGHTPILRTTQKGTDVLRLSLAVHQGEQTDWHTILFFGERAKELAQAEFAQKGRLVTVVGYPHQRDVRMRTGGIRQVEEVYGVVLRKS